MFERTKDPTRAQIRARCAEIQRTWSPVTEVRRRTVGTYVKGDGESEIDVVNVDFQGNPIIPVNIQTVRA
jgi:DUF971 family protein